MVNAIDEHQPPDPEATPKENKWHGLILNEHKWIYGKGEQVDKS